MKLTDLFTIKLDEVRQAPSNLKQFANSPAAEGIMAGFEAEMIFRDAKESEYDGDPEPDYDSDQRANSIEEIADFFYDGDYNGRSDINRLKESLREDYYEWLAEKSSEYFFANDKRIIKDWIEGEDWDLDEEIETCLRDDMDLSPEEVKAALAAGKKYASQITSSKQQRELREQDPDYDNYLTASAVADEKLDLMVEKELEEQGDIYYAAQENAREAFEEEEGDESDFLSDAGINYMSDVQDQYEITWPYWNYPESDDGAFSEYAAENLAETFKNIILPGQDIEVTSWAGKNKDPNTWYFESDSSISPDGSSDLAVEIVSPPMPLKECLAMLDKFFKWADKHDGYTNDSTGFHMGVSMPEQDSSKVDFVKLALFLGDRYVLEQFGRLGNTYCVSALSKIEDRISSGNVDPKRALEALKSGLERVASETIANSEGFGKFVTINPKQKYIEFRSAGGEDYSQDIDKLQSTLSRYAQAMWIASHPDMYRDEYQKKMYKLLDAADDKTDTIKELSKMAAGKSSDKNISSWFEHLKAVLQKSQIKRMSTKGDAVLQWQVRIKGTPIGAQVVARTAQEAIQICQSSDAGWGKLPIDKFSAEPIGPATPREIEGYNAGSVKTQAEPQATSEGAQWEVYDKTTGESVHRFNNPQNDMAGARQIGQTWYSANDIQLPRNQLGLRPVESSGTSVSRTQQPEPRTSGNEFTGEWRVVDGLNREVYRFGGIGNSQSDANRVAREWAQRTGFDGNMEVYPVMR